MNSGSLYRVSFYAMLVAATLVLSVDPPESPIARLYPAAVAVAGVGAFLTVDRNRSLGVSDLVLNLLAVGSAGLAFLEYVFDPTLLLLALGHWLVYLQLALMFRPKTVAEDWWLFLLGLVEVMVGAVLSQSDVVGAMLALWAVLALWVLRLFSLRRDAIRSQGGGRAPASASAGESGDEPYPGLLNWTFLFSALRVTLTTLALGGVIFLAMPRSTTATRSRGVEAPGQHLTGFDDEVQLGQMGEILENDSIVMSVELFDEDDYRVFLEGEPLWRGVTMAEYQSGRWFRQSRKAATFPILRRRPQEQAADRPRGVVRQQIKLEPNDSNVLFSLRPMRDAWAERRSDPEFNAVDGTISRTDSRAGAIDYQVRSYRDADLPQGGEIVPNLDRKNPLLLRMSGGLRRRFRAIALGVIEKDLPPDRREGVAERARALEAYLRESGRFDYSLKLGAVDPSIDPVEDFLVNRKEGHCEYFASALTLLLRSVDVPARMVNGFKGGDWNDLARVMSVRQKHAHSWVEAYLGETPGPDRLPVWLTLDPTPGVARDQSVARVGGFRGNFRQLTDLIRYVWVFYIVGYNAERQDRLLYAPLRALTNEAARGFGMIRQAFENGTLSLRGLLHFSDVRSFISLRGFAVSFTALLLLAALVRASAWLVRRFLRWVRGQGGGAGALSVGAAHYRRLALLLAEYGLERPPAETQEEFARRATVYLTARGSDTETVADVPGQVVEAFYRVRFGRLDLSPGALDHLEARLDALQARLQATHA